MKKHKKSRVLIIKPIEKEDNKVKSMVIAIVSPCIEVSKRMEAEKNALSLSLNPTTTFSTRQISFFILINVKKYGEKNIISILVYTSIPAHTCRREGKKLFFHAQNNTKS